MKGNHVHSAPYHPASNGAVERFNQTFKQALKASEKDGRSLSHRLSDFLLTYQSTPHATTQRTPSSLFLKRELRTRFSLLQPDVGKQVADKQADQIEGHDQQVKARSFRESQPVMVRNLRQSGSKWIPGTVLKQTGPLSYVVRTESGLAWKRHVDHLHEYTVVQPARTEQTSGESDIDDFDIAPSSTNPIETQREEPARLTETTRRYPSRNRRSPDRYM